MPFKVFALLGSLSVVGCMFFNWAISPVPQSVKCPICNCDSEVFSVTEQSVGYQCYKKHFVWTDRLTGFVREAR